VILSVVTPFWNHLDLLPGYYAPAINAGKPDEVIVIDNGSDPPFEPVGLDPLTVVIRNKTNRGFSRACNQGMWAASGDAVLFLNNDIQLDGAGEWCAALKAVMRPGVLVGARLRDDYHTTVDGELVPYLDGWCIGGMRDDLIELGGWDEGYAEPSYYGDNDLCVRATAAGFDLVQIKLPLFHLESVTARPLRLNEVMQANRARYVQRVRSTREKVAA
jgi:GT2 family glycosyltransferase